MIVEAPVGRLPHTPGVVNKGQQQLTRASQLVRGVLNTVGVEQHVSGAFWNQSRNYN
jgi:hypothetical protein